VNSSPKFSVNLPVFMSRRLERLIKLDELIRSPLRHTTADFAKLLEVGERTLGGDLRFLRDRYDAPLEYNFQRGWYYTNADWRLPSIILSTGELFALTLGARMLSMYAGSVYQTQLEVAIARLAERLPEEVWVDLQQLAEENVLVRVGAELTLDPLIWRQLEQACQRRQRVWIRYATPGKPVSEREVDPYVLHFSRYNPYVTGWCHLRDEVRWFRVDRIQALELREMTFEVDPSFDRKTYFADVFQCEMGNEVQEVAIWFDPATAPYIRERRWHSSQIIEEHADGALTLKLKVRGLKEVKRWVLFYGGGARALAPPELVEMVRGEVQDMNLLYQEDR
jgi:predicted DNA-binding transcriptional regulator YafY